MTVKIKDTEAGTVVLALKGIIFDLPTEERAKFDAAYADVKALIDKHGDTGKVALTLAAAEFAAE